MNRKILVLAGLVAVVAVVAGSLVVSARTTTLRAGLTGAKEVSATGEMGVGDPNGRGSATVRINVRRQRACFKLAWSRIVPPSMAHIHEGGADVAGPIVIPLFMTGDEAAQGTDQDLPDTLKSVGGCVSGVEKALLRAIRRSPRDYYVNIHNDDFPAGAIRGQLHR